jgi:hypothetical protein
MTDVIRRSQKTLEALFAQVETLARKNPVLMIFEDAHWTDPTSLEAFDGGPHQKLARPSDRHLPTRI